MNDEQFEKLLESLAERRTPAGVVERHAQTVMVGLVTIGIIWMSSSISNTNADVKVLTVQNEVMSAQIADLNLLIREDRSKYVPFTVYDEHLREHNRRFTRLERHMEVDEQGWKNR